MFETNAEEPLEEMQKSQRLLTERLPRVTICFNSINDKHKHIKPKRIKYYNLEKKFRVDDMTS